MPWAESRSPGFTARHAERDADDAIAVLELLENTRERLTGVIPGLPSHLEVIVHSSNMQLTVALPSFRMIRRLTAPAARRYVGGWFTASEIHLLAPRLLATRASSVPGSREMLMLTPAALYTQLTIGLASPLLPPPLRPWGIRAYRRWAWLGAGAGAWLSGQTAHARPAIARRLHEGRPPNFPPNARDAPLLGGTIFDLLAREEGEAAAVRLALKPAGSPLQALRAAFPGRDLVHTEGAWRGHLSRLASI